LDIEKEISLLKDQVKLLKSMVNGEDFPFFMFALDFNFKEMQMKAIVKILSAFKKRLEGKDLQVIKEDYLILEEYGIPLSKLLVNELPSVEEFDNYLESIVAKKSFRTKYLLNSIKKQHIHSDVCSYLLDQLN